MLRTESGRPVPLSLEHSESLFRFICFTITRKEKNTMRKFTQHLVSLLKNEDGPTAVEYAVMLALIIVVCITAITALGSNANNTFSYVGGQVGKTGS
jgi:pilus assembly protein Flp/PilA